MPNPIINVVPESGRPHTDGAIMVGQDDGTFRQYGTPGFEFGANSRAIIATAFFGGKNAKETDIPELSQKDFEAVVVPFWRTMCAGRTSLTGDQVKAIADATVAQIKVPAPSIDYAAVAKAVSDDVAKRLAQ